MFSREEVFNKTISYFNGDSLPTDVWIDKYCLKTNKGEYLEQTPREMHLRIAKEFSRIESKYPNPLSFEEIFDLLDGFKFIIPQGSPMEGIGNDNKYSTLSNCYVIEPPKDSYSGILFTEREMIELYKRRGGVGTSLHTLRSKEMPTSSVSEKSSGVVLFAERYSNTTREVAQDGRRGALMLSLKIGHPDSELFIDSKLDQGKITGANISIMVDDKFMNAVQKDEDYELRFEGLAGVDVKTIKAKKLWDKIVFNAWKSAEPGLLFWDNILKESPANKYGVGWEEKSCNPCAELPLPAYDSCRLLVLNLLSYVDKPFTQESSFNFPLFQDHTIKAQRLMDDLIDLEIEKIDRVLEKLKNDSDKEDDKTVEINLWNKIKSMAVNGRRTGLGITAEGDMLAALGFKYGTRKATEFSEYLHRVLAVETYKSSVILAEERGCFPIWDLTIDLSDKNVFVNRVFNEFSLEYKEKLKKFGRRNISMLTIAPTGSVSTLTKTTSGIEPLFLPFYTRRKKTQDPNKSVFKDVVGDMWEEYYVIHEGLRKWYDINKKEEFGKQIEELTKEELQMIFTNSPYFGATSDAVDYLEKVHMQGRIQKWIDHSISVTVNMPKDVTTQIVNDVYFEAWRSGCKGVTVYREGSRSGVLVSSKNQESELVYKDAVKRPKILKCDIHRKQVFKNETTILIGLLNGAPYEVFTFIADANFPKQIKNGEIIKVKKKHYRLVGELNGKTYTIDNIIDLLNENEVNETRNISTMLRHCIHPKYIIKQIRSYATINSPQKAIERVLSTYIQEEGEKCPSCGVGTLVKSEKCDKCNQCGWSKCG